VAAHGTVPRVNDAAAPGTSDDDHRPLLVRALLADVDHGPLPGLLVVMTIVTGLVDAVSVLARGRVFVAHMTRNVVFSGFALAGTPGFSLRASLVAGGAAMSARSPRRWRH
jgi:hypothetical protein